MGYHKESSTTSGLHDDSEEFGVDATEGGIPGGLGDPNIVIALLTLAIGTKHMSKLRLTNHTERHFKAVGFLGPI